MKNDALKSYLDELNKQYKTGIAREHAYRPALKDLLQTLLPAMVVTNDPARIGCGAPDYIVSREKTNLPAFFVEAKDIGDNDLDGRNKSGNKEQFDRYRQALDRIVFTDYLDFHLYEHGDFVDSVRIAEVKGDKIVGNNDAESKFLALIEHLGDGAVQRIMTANRLAKLMAGKARLLANIIETAMNDDTFSYENDNLKGQYQAFRDVLIHELKKQDFADIYAQTIAYGMFAARLHDETPGDFSREEAAKLIPKTNPFLRQIFNNIAGNDLDGRIAWVVDDLVTVFLATDLKKIMATYGSDKRHNDPMIHFYEDFLAEYSPQLRKAKGVWYTPQPVVGFIVRAVDEILQREFGIEDGLADYSKRDGFHRVQILDPAAGTGTFLAEVVNQIYDKYRNQQGIWQQYVEEHLLPRLNGFEILMASYAVAHIKLDMLLGETGYEHKSDRRLHVYLTNSLEESDNEPRTLFAQWLSREATEANTIKRDTPVMVMIGNPPYSISSQNNGKWITGLVADYKKHLNEKNIQPLSDDYIKFIRLAHHYIDKNGSGVVGIISNNSFIDGIIHRQMRKSLLESFDKIYILNLHGDSKKKETTPERGKDENVFDIMQGVSINIFVKTCNENGNSLATVYYSDAYGLRQDKYDLLNNNTLDSIEWQVIDCVSPSYFFAPKDFSLKEEYDKGFKIDELFIENVSGVQTGRDNLFIDNDSKELSKRIEILLNNQFDGNFKAAYNIQDSSGYNLLKRINDCSYHSDKIVEYNYRPFDRRYIYYEEKLIKRAFYRVLNNLLYPSNVALLVCKQAATEKFGYFVTNIVCDINFTGTAGKFGAGLVFPLYIYKKNMGLEEKIPNLNAKILSQIEEKIEIKIVPEELFDYIYAVFHSPNYRKRYREFLKIDFPRIPYPEDADRYKSLVAKGKELRRLHLMEGLPNDVGISFPQSGSMQVENFRWEGNRVYINDVQYFDGVPETAWNFYVGGYQPAQKWLKDRKGMPLGFNDVKHYERIIYVLIHTDRIMKEIDNEMSTTKE